jgi:hypothetical protein
MWKTLQNEGGKNHGYQPAKISLFLEFLQNVMLWRRHTKCYIYKAANSNGGYPVMGLYLPPPTWPANQFGSQINNHDQGVGPYVSVCNFIDYLER